MSTEGEVNENELRRLAVNALVHLATSVPGDDPTLADLAREIVRAFPAAHPPEGSSETRMSIAVSRALATWDLTQCHPSLPGFSQVLAEEALKKAARELYG